jgi:IclR family transcriptional regulator, pca regulon regulatory protein
LGRVLLAGLPPDEAARRVHAMPRPLLSPRTVTDADEVLALVARCREEGYASNDGELELDVRSMAVPVFDRSGQVMAAMSIAVRAERMTLAEVRETFLPALRKAAGSLLTWLHAA